MSTSQPERGDIEEGLELARKMLLSTADGDQAAALFALNTATEGAAKWAASYLLAIVGEQAAIVARFTKPRVSVAHLFRTAAAGIDEDILTNQVDDVIARLTREAI